MLRIPRCTTIKPQNSEPHGGGMLPGPDVENAHPSEPMTLSISHFATNNIQARHCKSFFREAQSLRMSQQAAFYMIGGMSDVKEKADLVETEPDLQARRKRSLRIGC